MVSVLVGPQSLTADFLLPWSPENEQVCLLPTLAESHLLRLSVCPGIVDGCRRFWRPPRDCSLLWFALQYPASADLAQLTGKRSAMSLFV